MPKFAQGERIVATLTALGAGLLALMALPDKLSETWDKAEETGHVLWGNPLSAVALGLAIIVAIIINWDLIDRTPVGAYQSGNLYDKLSDELLAAKAALITAFRCARYHGA